MRAWVGLAALVLAGGCAVVDEIIEGPPPSDSIPLPSWAERGPGPNDYLRVYPPVARRAGLEGSVRLDCAIRTDRTLDCAPLWEEYPGYGFDQAALTVSKLFVLKKTDQPALQPGSRIVLPIRFALED